MKLFINTYPLISHTQKGKLYKIMDDFIKSYPLIYLTLKGKLDSDIND